MQEKFANKASNKTGQIKSISKYEMLYIPKSIPVKRVHVNSSVVIESSSSSSSLSLSSSSVASSSLSSSNVNFNRSKHQQWSSNCIGQLVKQKLINNGFAKIFITLIVCLLWISSVGFVYGDSNVKNDFRIIHSNKNQTNTVQPQSTLLINWWRPLEPIPQQKSNNAINRRHSQSSMLILNVLKSDTERSEHFLDANHIKNISNGSFKQNHQQHQRQQFGISIITRSKKTNPNASFSLDLFQQNTDEQHVQRQKNQTLNRLEKYDTNRIPDAIRKSLHHHHSVIKRFRAFVTKRYHFSAKTKDNQSNINSKIIQNTQRLNEWITRTTATTIVSNDTTSNDQLIKSTLNHPIHNITTIQIDSNHNSDDDDDDQQQQLRSTLQRRKNAQNKNTENNNIFTLMNRSTALQRNLHKKHFDSHEINGMNITISSNIVHHNRKRSTDLHEIQQTPTKPTPTNPFDDHFFNSKLKNYYFLYHIDNISNYNNHFNLLNSPSIYNAIQLKLNKKNIQFSNRQIDNALIDATNTESDFSKYNISQKQLHFNNHSNHIKHILLAKIASVCLNCVNGENGADSNGKILPSISSSSSQPSPSPMKIYILPRSLRSIGSLDDHGQNDHGDSGDNHIQDWDEPTFQNSLKNYPRIAGLLGNLSLNRISDQFNYRKNQNVHPNTRNSPNNFNFITDFNDSNNDENDATTIATALATMVVKPTPSTISIKTVAIPLSQRTNVINATAVTIPFSKSLKTKNQSTTNNANPMDTTIRADATATHISTNNYSPISTFEHYIKVISSRNINNRKNYYAIQTNGNKSKSLNFQNLKQQKFQRVKKQKQIIKLFATNHRFILNNTMNDNNINKNVNDTVVAIANDDHATDNTNIVINYKLKHFNLNESNCTITNVLNFDSINSNHTNIDATPMQQAQQQLPASQMQQQNHIIAVNEMKNNAEASAKFVKDTNEVPIIEKRSKFDRMNESNKMKTGKKKTNKFGEKIRSSSSENSHLMRLESIKYQILMKLGLKQKPNITNTLPKHVIMETLYRADDNHLPHSNGNQFIFEIFFSFIFILLGGIFFTECHFIIYLIRKFDYLNTIRVLI